MMTLTKHNLPVLAKPSYVLATYSIGHMIVDGACALSILSLYWLAPLNWEAIYRLIILYNVIAFGLQPLFGHLLDAYKAHHYGATAGLFITAAGAVIAPAAPSAAVVIFGLGNALFHTGAGAQVFANSGGSATASGIFIAPGAIGLFLGGILAKGHIHPFFSLPALCVSALLLLLCPSIKSLKKPADMTAPARYDWRLVIVMFLMFIVLSRSAAGFVLPLMLQGTQKPILLFVIAAFAGKFFGGVLADRFGWLSTTFIFLCAAGGMAAMHQESLFVAFFAMLFVQATTGVTLAATQSVFPNRPGFAFGLPCIAILAAAYPFSLRYPLITPPAGLVASLCFTSALVIMGIKLFPKSETKVFGRRSATQAR